MNLAPVDWLILGASLAGVAIVALLTRRYTRSVSDFLAGSRCGGRYLLTLAEGVGDMSLVTIAANFEKFFHAGFVANWWGTYMIGPIAMITALAGWVSCRYRETRAMTMAQFFEMRYSRRFRVFTGVLGWASGVLNFGIFPGIVARFIVYFCGLPASVRVWGTQIPTMALVMALILAISLVLVLSGGMITLIIGNFFQAQVINITFLCVAGALVAKFAWGDVAATLMAAPKGGSLLDPFDQAAVADFNVWFFLIFAFKTFYNRLGWQGTQGFNCAAKSPHETRMAGILAEWRGGANLLVVTLIPICACVLLNNPKFAGESQAIQSTLATIPEKQIQAQMTVPIALVRMLPPGVLGMMLAAMVAGTIGNFSTTLHAWGSIFVQDVLLPFRGNRALAPERHFKLLRLSITGVAVFSFLFSLLFPLRDYILMYQLITGAIYLGGSGAAIIGGLYWRRGTTAGAWGAMITGAAMAVIGGTLRAVWPAVPGLVKVMPQFPVNGAWMALIGSLAAILVYVAVSLLTCKADFNMEKLLHRGRYAVGGERREADRPHPLQWLGITHEFTRGDRVIYFVKIGWTFFWFAAFIAGSVWACAFGVSNTTWAHWWLFTVGLGLAVGAVTVVWFLWGGVRNLREFIAALGTLRRDAHDNGEILPAPLPETAPASPRKPQRR